MAATQRAARAAVLLFSRDDWPRHRRPALGCLLVALAASAWYAAGCVRASALLGGASLPGLVCGAAAALLLLFELSYGVRKLPPFAALYGRWPAQALLRWHIWLGLLAVPLALLHSGLRLGGPLPAALAVVFALVVLSGAFGLALQQVVPRLLRFEVADETVPSEAEALEAELLQVAELVVQAACRADREDAPQQRLAALRATRERLRAEGQGRGAGGLSALPARPLEDGAALRAEYRRAVEPFLRSGRPEPGPGLWDGLRRRLGPEGGGVLDALEALCARRRQLDRQRRLHGWLRSWLAVHQPLSASLLVLLAWHAVAAVVYW